MPVSSLQPKYTRTPCVMGRPSSLMHRAAYSPASAGPLSSLTPRPMRKSPARVAP